MHVAFDHARRAENLATHGIAENMRVQPLAQTRSFRKLENAAVVHDAGTDISPAQRNDPDPPSAAEQMIGGPFTRGTRTISVIWKAFSPFIAVPLFDAAESRPDGVDGMLGIRTKMSESPSDHCRSPCRIDKPTASGPAIAGFATIDNDANALPICAVQLVVCYLCRTPELATRLHSEIEHVRIKFCPVQLKTRQSALVACADLDAIVKALIGLVRKPQAQSLFCQLMMTEIMGQA